MGQLDKGSFRDREGRVYVSDKRVFRGLSAQALEAWRGLSERKFFRRAVDAGEIVGTRELEDPGQLLPTDICEQWAGFLEHQRIPIISYPYEWSFGMLRDAALLQLKLIRQALNAGFMTKDATPYNIQFVDRKPVFIDVASFEPFQPGSTWTGYRQFCEMFLFPLLLQSYKGVDFQPFLRSRIDGIGVKDAGGLFGIRDRFRKGVMSHVWLQSKLDRRYGGSSENVRGSLKSAGFHKELIFANLRKLEKLVGGLKWSGSGSEWGDYSEFHNYSAEDHERKETFISDVAKSSGADLAWDVGCNTGQFSRLLAEHCSQVVAMDIDHLAVDRLYRNEDMPSNILPLLQNVSDPSPSWGWRNAERTELSQRSKPELVVCLALIHHVVITANVPLAEFVEWLSGIAPQLVIEYVSREDDKVQQLLRNKDDRYSDYNRENLQSQLEKYYRTEKSISLRDGMRTLYWCRRNGA